MTELKRGISTHSHFIKLFHAKEDDPAGFLALCIITTFICVIIATAAAVFEKILQKGIEIRSENEQLREDKK